MTKKQIRKPNAAFLEQRLRWGSQQQAADLLNSVADDLGINLGCTDQQIRRLENGTTRWPNLDYVAVITRAAGRSMADLGFPPRSERGCRGRTSTSGSTGAGTVSLGEHQGADKVDRRTFLAVATTTTAGALQPQLAVAEPDAADPTNPIEQLASAVRRLRAADQVGGAGGVYPDAVRWLRTAYRLLNDASWDGRTERELQLGAGELAVAVGWLAHDMGLLSDARTFYTEAQAAARLADDPHLEVHALCNLSSLASAGGRPREALRLAEAAQRVASPVATGWLNALLCLREANAWATLGEKAPTQRALVRANRAFETGPREADPEWIAFFGSAQMSSIEASCWSALGNHTAAAVMVERAANVAGERFVRDRAMHHTRAAHEYLTAGDHDAADQQLAQVLPLLPRISSARLASTLRDLATRNPSADHGSVRDYVARQMPQAGAL